MQEESNIQKNVILGPAWPQTTSGDRELALQVQYWRFGSS